jgi:hypothetical protein
MLGKLLGEGTPMVRKRHNRAVSAQAERLRPYGFAPVVEKPLGISGFSVKAEGEGFEPSIRLTTDNGFRDRQETPDLQGFYCSLPVRSPASERSVREDIAAAAHARQDAGLLDRLAEGEARVLRAPVGVMDEAWLRPAPRPRHLELVDDQLGAQIVGHRPADDLRLQASITQARKT